MKIKTTYAYVVIGTGISGCSVAYELYKHSNSVLLIDSNDDVAQGASGAAGAFLSPLLGKANEFKDLVTTSLKYSTSFYKKNTPDFIETCGTVRIPKDQKDANKFKSYIPYIDFEYKKMDGGYLFDIGSVVNTYSICKELSKNIDKLFNYEVKTVEYKDNLWIINNKYKTKNLILTTGARVNLIDEKYFNIRAVWGQRIDIETSTFVSHNYHKECSVSKSFEIEKNRYRVSIGATHYRLNEEEKDLCTKCVNLCVKKDDTEFLINKANDIIKLDNIKVIKEVSGARSCSVDYLPMVGELIDSKKTLEEFPYLKNGTNVKENRFTRYKNLFVLNGVGGRGFVLAPYLAKQLVDFIIEKKDIDNSLTVNRLFKRWVKKLN